MYDLTTLVQAFYRYIHPNYPDTLIRELLTELNTIAEALKGVNTSPPVADLVFKFLEQDPCDRHGILLGMDPYPSDATGIPFEDPAFNKMSNKNLAANICRIYELEYKFVSSFNLYNLVPSYKLFLMNAALTVPAAVYGQRSTSGQHFGVWSKFMKLVMTHVLRHSPDCMFVLIFGKASYLQDLSAECIQRANSNAFRIVSYHPCMATYFMSEKSNPFQEVNALLRLYDKPPIHWYQAIGGLESVQELEEKRVIEDTSSFSFLQQRVKVCDMNDYQCLLGDLERGVIEQLTLKVASIDELSRVHDKSLAVFRTTSLKILSNVSTPLRNVTCPPELSGAVCAFRYSLSAAEIFLMHADRSHYVYSVPPLTGVFNERFGCRHVMGFFSLEMNGEERIPINSYELLIDVIFSQMVDYQLMEACCQLVSKIKPIRDGIPPIIGSGEYTRNSSHVLQTITGFAYHADKLSLKLLTTKHPLIELASSEDNVAGSVFVVLRSFPTNDRWHNMKSRIESSRGRPHPHMSLQLIRHKDYQKAYTNALTLYAQDIKPIEIAKQMIKEPSNGSTDGSIAPSVFHIAVALTSKLTPRVFQSLCPPMFNGAVFISPVSEMLDANRQEIEKLTAIISVVQERSKVNERIRVLVKQNDQLAAAEDIINNINLLHQYSNA